MAQLRYRFCRCLAGSVAKWTFLAVPFLEQVKNGRKFHAVIGGTDSKHWRVTDITMEIDGWLLPYVIESSENAEITSADVEKHG